MSVLIFAKLNIHNRERYNRYMEKAGPMFVEHGVKIHAADDAPRIMGGGHADKVVLMEFRDHDHMQGFMSNPDYVEIAKDRDAGADLTSTMFNRMKWPPE
jgi:uncharacterized protein (DUF1330 family)